MRPAVVLFVAITKNVDEARSLGLKEPGLSAEMQTVVDYPSLRGKVLSEVKVIYLFSYLSHTQEKLERAAERMIAGGEKKTAKEQAAAVGFEVDDEVFLLAPGDPSKKRNILKKRHDSHGGPALSLLFYD
jgi:hypothetical protein